MFLPLLLLCTVSLPSQDAAPPAPESVEAEILRNVLGQQIGPGTVADLALPDEYLARVVGRIVRSSFDERIGVVVPDEDGPNVEAGDTGGPSPESVAGSGHGLAYGAGYAALALGFALWFALRSRKGTA